MRYLTKGIALSLIVQLRFILVYTLVAVRRVDRRAVVTLFGIGCILNSASFTTRQPPSLRRRMARKTPTARDRVLRPQGRSGGPYLCYHHVPRREEHVWNRNKGRQLQGRQKTVDSL
ncbi:hypothetical protein PHLGIDRAFT_451507 [Phlebiopsis gigantea 11061_1 CR5-6]|uniref:Uncharacterized protein n=1 Tax=Phlebiopsis gigantea (strain 11061_1 CR5-6) TaxID=745531 RepID=A0A0C3PK33_PHLG1|nr:hypothetical protein PHLGIDRAFT_451507 [Phlebiopsis gigantea 11061_1 CR5-6]